MRDIVGASTLERSVDEKSTVNELIELLKQEFPGWAKASTRTVVAVNQEFVDLNTPLAEGDEVAFFPPVTGG